MSNRIMKAAVQRAAPVYAPNDEYPIKIDKVAATKKAAETLLADSPLPKWFPDVTWTIVEVHAHPFPERMVGHGNRRGAANHLLAFIIVQDEQAAQEDHWMYFKINDALPTPLVELVHTREHHATLDESTFRGVTRHHASPGRQFDWIVQCGVESVEQLGTWLAGIDATVAMREEGKARAIQEREDQEAAWYSSPAATDVASLIRLRNMR